MKPPGLAPKSIEDLYGIFGERAPASRPVAPERVPQPYRRLLAHQNHMTVTLESHHDTLVKLTVLASAHLDHLYARKILLHHGETMSVVQFGIMQFNFAYCSAEVRDLILAQKIPLGRILASSGALRRISTHGLLAVTPDAEIRTHFGLSTSDIGPVYGRLATIFCDGEPAVDLLEIVAPEPG